MISISPKDISTGRLHGYLLGAVSPRPIAFASTVDENGDINLAPFSFFNVFSANPPILIFSPARRGRDNTTKHTFDNVLKVKEVVINIVNFDMVQQMSLASTEYPKGVNEFIKSGLTPIASEVVKPPRVLESPVQFECKVKEVVILGKEGGAGNLVICEVLRIHIKEEILDKNGVIDQHKIDTVARMGGNWYSRSNMGMFEVPKPLSTLGIGVDQISEEIKTSKVLTGNDLGKLGNIESLPTEEEVAVFVSKNMEVRKTISTFEIEKKHTLAQKYLTNGDVLSAWKVLLAKI
ncbi:MAG: flavin reductase [Flavobacteriaceae bacterium CG_4_8_14_3_um_filter_34_10]|nr:flavin reductase family protein [Flavobacteriia bacterium]OIP51267.1 MAG: flavin reductase [Flavobacteriaceae bacterium CG2_30_34_30]PIQ18672.1 MAG: flavin reductase [Flavobacteriaceae bacterium CG18_big_fil_WC_8_21_14_2_50_34_36]PIV48778.1 MAG: flavin reductase [Flavobacteriaceae bacterium CG02_land_8_20_14_3_00_34_13]PIX09413.1 MAG: flavin reductase [Flavobacteriaceae bacterium CG_4_8_14_3_um_filter_34_10]PIZ07623.1 MAG: flavin reductase [Flavobacteriaceae bacterium CG_4_10_14_0_8_um_filt